MLEINHITVHSAKIAHPLTFALCPDFHNGDVDLVLSACRDVDAILVAGDLVDRHDHRTNGFDNAVRFLHEAPDVAPVFYSIGNHERKLPALAEYWPHVEKSRVTVLDDRFVEFGGIVLGGLSSIRVGKDEHKLPLQLVEMENADDHLHLYPLKEGLYSRQPAVVTRRGQYISEYAAYAIELLKQ